MFNITNHWGAAKQNYDEIPAHARKDGWLLLKKKTPGDNKCW